MDAIGVIIGERLRKLREGVGISQGKISKIVTYDQSSVNRYEKGTRVVPYKVLLWYADYFDVSLDYLYGRTDKPQGKVYKYESEELKKKFANPAQMEQFIEMCFDPNSTANAKLKEMMKNLIRSDSE